MSEQPDAVILSMHADDIREAIVEARTRTSDATVMARVGDSPDPETQMPGLYSVEAAGRETVYGLTHDEALAALNAL